MKKRDSIEGKFKQIKGATKQQLGRLTNNQQMEASGDREILAGKIQEKYGMARRKVAKQVAKLKKHTPLRHESEKEITHEI